MKQIISTKKPQIPAGFRKIRYDLGKYKGAHINKTPVETQGNNPVWAEIRYDKNAIFEGDKKYYVLWTYIKD